MGHMLYIQQLLRLLHILLRPIAKAAKCVILHQINMGLPLVSHEGLKL